jgi:hypothetical protein
LELSGHFLIEFMAGTLGLCLCLRWMAYLSSKRNDAYFSTLGREISNAIEKDKEEGLRIIDIDTYVGQFFSKISAKLPNRSFRFKKDEETPGKKTISIQGYLSGRENFVNILKSEASVFQCQTPPNFSELTQRILGQDQHWSKMLKNLPVDWVSRLIDIMPGLFVVFGVFGTFVGICLALAEIAKIDFSNIEGSSKTLASFVSNTAYAIETSLAGIVFSVLTTVMNALVPIKDVRHRIHKKVENSLQTLWYHVHFSSKAENEMISVLRELNKTLKSIKND